jgi:hypothetical protein
VWKEFTTTTIEVGEGGGGFGKEEARWKLGDSSALGPKVF